MDSQSPSLPARGPGGQTRDAEKDITQEGLRQGTDEDNKSLKI